MKTETFRKVKPHSVMITLFFAGIIVSGSCLHAMNERLTDEPLRTTSLIVASTFMLGIISISLVQRAESKRVVYLEKKLRMKKFHCRRPSSRKK